MEIGKSKEERRKTKEERRKNDLGGALERGGFS
jgi:hypothetical protein